jgi:hypothetical protein
MQVLTFSCYKVLTDVRTCSFFSLKFYNRYLEHIPVANAWWMPLLQVEESRWCSGFFWLSTVYKTWSSLHRFNGHFSDARRWGILELKLGLYNIQIQIVYTHDYEETLMMHLLYYNLPPFQRLSCVSDGLINYLWNKN